MNATTNAVDLVRRRAKLEAIAAENERRRPRAVSDIANEIAILRRRTENESIDGRIAAGRAEGLIDALAEHPDLAIRDGILVEDRSWSVPDAMVNEFLSEVQSIFDQTCKTAKIIAFPKTAKRMRKGKNS